MLISQKLLVTAAILFATSWTWFWLGGNDPRVAFTDFEDFGDGSNVAFVQVAAAYGPWKRNALYLLCRASGRYQFVLKSRLIPFDRGEIDHLLPIKAPSKASITLGRRRAPSDKEYETQFQVTRTGLVDTIVSPEFDRGAAAQFSSMFRAAAPEVVNVHMRVQSVFMKSTSDIGQIDHFQKSCNELG